MKFTICGARGSFPIARPDQTIYGGNTSCHLFQSDDTNIVFDLGTGSRIAGNILMDGDFARGKGHADIFLTHFMWDHIIGMPFFSPLFVKGNHFSIYTPKIKKKDPHSFFSGLFDPAYSPVPMSKIKADLDFIEIEADQTIELNDKVSVSSILLNHPGVTLGYRLDAGSRSFCYITDTSSWFHPLLSSHHEAGRFSATLSFRHKMHRRLIKFVKNADWVMFDTHFSDDNIPGHEDWGHASPGYALNICKKAEAKRLILYHHDPEKSDMEIERSLFYTRDMAAGSIQVELAREGAVIDWSEP